MINSDCSICLDSLDNKGALASLFCGHVFHYACILQCSEHQRSTCPLCQKDIHQYQHPVIRLYLDLDSTDNESKTQEPDERHEKLKRAHLDLNNKLALLERKYAQKKKRLEQSEQQRKTLAENMDLYKNIAGVLELEAQLETQNMQLRLQRFRQMDKDELCLTVATFHQHMTDLRGKLKHTDEQLKRAYLKLSNMKNRYRALKREDVTPKRSEIPLSDQSGQAKRKRLFNPDEILSTKKRDKQPAIQVDSDETDDPDDLCWVSRPPANTSMNESETLARSKQIEQPSSSSSSSSAYNHPTSSGQSRHHISEAAKKLVRKKKLQRMGIYGNGFLPPLAMNATDDAHHNDNDNDNDSNNNNSNSNGNNIDDEDVAILDDDEDVAILDDDDDGYVSPSSPLPPLRIVSPVRNITLPNLARPGRVIELSSDEENENYLV